MLGLLPLDSLQKQQYVELGKGCLSWFNWRDANQRSARK
jgi:hypothetical protein